MFFVYVLHSQSSGKRYIGQTADLDRRLKEHNDPSHNLAKYNSRNAAPWILLHREQNETRAAAMSQEKWLKSGVGREWPHAQFDRTGPPLNHGLTQRRKEFNTPITYAFLCVLAPLPEN
jgi:putative endonuclease